MTQSALAKERRELKEAQVRVWVVPGGDGLICEAWACMSVCVLFVCWFFLAQEDVCCRNASSRYYVCSLVAQGRSTDTQPNGDMCIHTHLQRIAEIDSETRDLTKPWEDPAADMADRQLAMGVRGMSSKVGKYFSTTSHPYLPSCFTRILVLVTFLLPRTLVLLESSVHPRRTVPPGLLA